MPSAATEPQNGIFDDDNDDLCSIHGSSTLLQQHNASYSKPVLNAINKLTGTPVALLPPKRSGRRKNPNQIIDLNQKWAATRPRRERGITIFMVPCMAHTHDGDAFEKGLLTAGDAFPHEQVRCRPHPNQQSFCLLCVLQGVVGGGGLPDGGNPPPMAIY